MTYRDLVVADGATHYYPCDDATLFLDDIGSIDGTPQGGTPVTLIPGAIPAGGLATVYDGVDDRVTLPGLVVADTGPCSLEVWFKAAASASAYLFDGANGVGATSGITCQLHGTGITAGISDGAVSTTVTVVVSYDDLHWHHLVVTLSRGPDTLRLYLDGDLVDTTVCASDGGDVTNTFQYCFGATAPGTDFLTGALDECAVYPTALSDAQVAAHHAYGATYLFRIRHGSLRVRDTVGDAPTTLSLTVQGERPPGNAPVRIGVEDTTFRLAVSLAGSDATPVDVADAVLLFEGVLQTIEERYDGLPTRLSWDCTAIDHVYELNARRPFGTFEDVAAHTVIETIMATYAPAFDLAFVQQIEVLVTITFDGSLEMAECLSAIAAQLGACHWYLDLFALHFYHVGFNDGDVVVETRPTAPTALTAPTLSGVAAVGFKLWSLFALTHVYSNGLESQVSDSLLVDVDQTFALEFGSLPLGSTFAGMAVVKRYLYQRVLPAIGYTPPQQHYVYVIPDNTSTSYVLAAPSEGPRVPPVRSDVDAPPPTTAPNFVTSGSSGISAASRGVRFAVAFVYETGVESTRGPWSPGQIIDYSEGLFTLSDLEVGGTNVDGKAVLLRAVYIQTCFTGLGFAAGDLVQGCHFIPNNTDTDWEMVTYTPGLQPFFSYGNPVAVTPFISGRWPILALDAGPTFGPSLEDDLEQPDDLTDGSPTLIRDDPRLTSSEDSTQLRTRVFVHGASRSLTVATLTTDTVLEVTDVAIFDIGGGTVLVNGVRLAYASITGGTTLVLPAGATVGVEWPIGTPVALWVQCDDYAAQAALGEREAVAGTPTDGVREFTIVDTSLDSVARCLDRGMAELVLFARPILTVRYGTFDPKTRAGRFVAIDLTDPPLQHDGLLIQEVTIDRFQVGPSAWPPRYTVTASSVRFTLDDLLRRVRLDDP